MVMVITIDDESRTSLVVVVYNIPRLKDYIDLSKASISGIGDQKYFNYR